MIRIVNESLASPETNPSQCGRACLVLHDGTVFEGQGFGAPGKVTGEVVFSTSMTGYPESLTDPSYRGQILTLTYPLVGNYGVPTSPSSITENDQFESDGIKVAGLVIHELCEEPSHWSSTRSLHTWLASEGIPGIYGIDTRRLTKKLRVHGVMLGILEVAPGGHQPEVEKLCKEAERIPDPNLRDLVGEVSVKEPVPYEVGGRGHLALIDCGVKYGIIRNLLKRKVNVLRIPYKFSAEEIMDFRPAGVVISNGPGDPKICKETIETTRRLIDANVPVMGICLGNQILSLALGGDTYKLKYGHRSHNQPALDVKTGRCYITSQNHGYAVRDDSPGEGLSIWFINANDRTVEALRHESKPAFSVQWHPEASPGPYDTEFLFDLFLKEFAKI